MGTALFLFFLFIVNPLYILYIHVYMYILYIYLYIGLCCFCVFVDEQWRDYWDFRYFFYLFIVFVHYTLNTSYVFLTVHHAVHYIHAVAVRC